MFVLGCLQPPSSCLPLLVPCSLLALLVATFLAALDLAIQTVRHAPPEAFPASGPPSYNVVLTLEHVHVVPRAREVHALAATGRRLR